MINIVAIIIIMILGKMRLLFLKFLLLKKIPFTSMFCQLFQLKYQILFGLWFPTEISETPWNKRCKTAQNILSGFVFFIYYFISVFCVPVNYF